MNRGYPTIVWLKVIGIVLVVLACDLAVGAAALITASLLRSADRVALWVGVGSLGFGFFCVTTGLLFVNRAYRWQAESTLKVAPEGIGPASSVLQRELDDGDVDLRSITADHQEEAPTN
jgi:uncharacterized membrane protein